MNIDVSVNGNISIIDFELHLDFCTEEAKSSVFAINLGFAACKTFNLFSSLQVKSPVLQSLKAAPDIFQRALQKPQEERVGRSLLNHSRLQLSQDDLQSQRKKWKCPPSVHRCWTPIPFLFICVCHHCSHGPQCPSEWQKGISSSSPRGRRLSSLQAVTSS